MDLINVKTGKTEDIDGVQVPQLLAAGSHVPKDGFAVISPDGQLGIMPRDKVHEALQQGYKTPTQPDLDIFAHKAKYGGDVNMAKAFGLGLMRGPSLSASDVALTKSGLVDPETIKGLEVEHPEASVAGELVGTGAAALLAPEVEGPMVASDIYNPVSGIARIGKGIAKDIAPEGAGLVKKIVGGIAGGAAEGAIFNEAATTLHETALGDPDLTAEKLIGNLGLGALVGGGLGAIGGVGSAVLKKSSVEAKDALSAGWKRLFGEAAEAGATPEAGAEVGIIPNLLAKGKEAAFGTPAEETRAAWANRNNILSSEDFDKNVKAIKNDLQEVYDKVGRAAGKAGELVRPQESANLLENVPAQPAMEEVGKVRKVIDTAVAEMRNERDLYPARFARELEIVSEGLENGIHPEATAADLHSELTRTKKILADKIDWKIKPHDESSAAMNILKDVHSAMKDSLENEQIWGEAGARNAAFNESASAQMRSRQVIQKLFMTKHPATGEFKVDPQKVQTFLSQIKDARGEVKAEALKDFFDKSITHIDQIDKAHAHAPHEIFDKETLEGLVKGAKGRAEKAQTLVAGQHPDLGYGSIHNLFTLSSLGRFATDPAKLAAMESLAKTTSSRISRAAKVIFRPLEQGAKRGYGVIAEHMPAAEKAERFKKRVNEARENVSSADTLIAKLDHATSAGSHVAPKTMAAVQAASIRGMQFLASKAPVLSPPSIFQKAPEPSQQQIDKFDRYHEAVHHPLTVLSELKSGYLSPETMETLQTVYPKLLEHMQTAMIDELTNLKDPSKVPYTTRMMLSRFMGQPLDPSLTPQSMQIMQQAMAMPTEKSQPPQPGAPGLQNLTIAERSATDFQHQKLGTA